MKRLTTRLLTAGVLLWGTGVSCQRDDPTSKSCNDNTCCGQDNGQYNYIEYINDAPAALIGPPDFSGWGLALKDSLPSMNALKNYSTKKRTTLVPICDLSLPKVQNLKISTNSLLGLTSYNYRVSGKVFQLPLTYTLTDAPVLQIYVDRITLIE